MPWEKIRAFVKPFNNTALVLVIGYFLVRLLSRIISRPFVRAKFDDSLVRFIRKAVKIVGYIIVFTTALATLGVPVTSLAATLSGAALAIGVALGIYFGLRDVLSIDTVSWLCILGAAPFALLGFVRYNGMPAERCLAVIVQSIILSNKKLVFVGSNLYYDMLLPVIKKKEKEMRKRHA